MKNKILQKCNFSAAKAVWISTLNRPGNTFPLHCRKNCTVTRAKWTRWYSSSPTPDTMCEGSQKNRGNLPDAFSVSSKFSVSGFFFGSSPGLKKTIIVSVKFKPQHQTQNTLLVCNTMVLATTKYSRNSYRQSSWKQNRFFLTELWLK